MKQHQVVFLFSFSMTETQILPHQTTLTKCCHCKYPPISVMFQCCVAMISVTPLFYLKLFLSDKSSEPTVLPKTEPCPFLYLRAPRVTPFGAFPVLSQCLSVPSRTLRAGSPCGHRGPSCGSWGFGVPRISCPPAWPWPYVAPAIAREKGILGSSHEVLGNFQRVLPPAEVTETHDNHFPVVQFTVTGFQNCGNSCRAAKTFVPHRNLITINSLPQSYLRVKTVNPVTIFPAHQHTVGSRPQLQSLSLV